MNVAMPNAMPKEIPKGMPKEMSNTMLFKRIQRPELKAVLITHCVSIWSHLKTSAHSHR